MGGFVFGQKPYRAVASLVIVRFDGDEGWQDAYVYAGQFLPAAADPFQVESLLKDGLIEAVEISSTPTPTGSSQADAYEERFEAAVEDGLRKRLEALDEGTAA